MKSVFLSYFTLLVFLGISCQAQERFTHTQTGLGFYLPAGWSYMQEGDHFEATNPGETVVLLFFVSQTQEAAEGIEAIGHELDQIMTQTRMTTEVTQEVVNGLTQIYGEGDGLLDGQRVDWDFTMVMGGAKSMIVVALGELEKNQATIDWIYSSIQR